MKGEFSKTRRVEPPSLSMRPAPDSSRPEIIPLSMNRPDRQPDSLVTAAGTAEFVKRGPRRASRGQSSRKFKALIGNHRSGRTAREFPTTADFDGGAVSQSARADDSPGRAKAEEQRPPQFTRSNLVQAGSTSIHPAPVRDLPDLRPFRRGGASFSMMGAGDVPHPIEIAAHRRPSANSAAALRETFTGV